MFDVGFWELVLIFGVGLIILGPERMPRVASQVGRWIGRARRTASSLRRQLEQEIASVDSPAPPPRKTKPFKPVNRPTPEKPVTKPVDDSAESPAGVTEPTGAERATEPETTDEGDAPQAVDGDAEQTTSGPANGL